MSSEPPKKPEIVLTPVKNRKYKIEIIPGPSCTFGQLPEDDPLRAKIGRVTIEWSRLESRLDYIISQFLGGDMIAVKCVTDQMMGIAPRFRAIISLAKRSRLDPKIAERALTLMQKTFDISEQRNRIVHDPWFRVVETGEPYQQVAISHKSKAYGFQKRDPKDLDKAIATIQKRFVQVTDLGKEVSLVMRERREARKKRQSASRPQSDQ